MIEKYDVIIVGAGIPGLYLCRKLASQVLKTLLIEQFNSIGGQDYSTAGIPKFSTDKFELPAGGKAEQINKYILGTSTQEAVRFTSTTSAYTLDFKLTKELLAEQCLQHKASLHTSEKFVSVDQNSDEITITTTKGKYLCNFLVDASGANAVVLKSIGLRKANQGTKAVGIEKITKVKGKMLDKYKNSFAIYVDKKLIPNGYGWIYSYGKGRLKIGVCKSFYQDIKDDSDLESILDSFLTWLGKEDVTETLDAHGGIKFIYGGSIPIFKGNILGIGDAIFGINPFLGEGIRHGLYSAEFAYESILDVIDGREKDLHIFQKKWNKYIGFRWKLSQIVNKLIYFKQSNKVLNQLIKMVDQKLTVEELIKVAADYKFEIILLKDPIGVAKMFWYKLTDR